MTEFNQFLADLLSRSPGLGVAIMMNNYFHDVATALLIASAFCIYALVRTCDELNEPVANMFYLRAYRRMVKIFRFSLYWIIIGGVPRTIFYSSFEWNNASGNLQVPALVVKHVLMVFLVVLGFQAWRKLSKREAALIALIEPKV